MILYAHRGDTTQHLENTRAAFDAALARGFQAFELDLLRTKDNRIVVFHDFWLRRLFRRHRRVRGITTPDFLKIFPDLLLFDEFAERYGKQKIVINLEVKDDVETLRRAEPLIAKFHQPVISSFDPDIVHVAARMGLEAGYLFHTKGDFLRNREGMKTRRLHISHEMLHDDLAHELYGSYEVHTYTVNDAEEALGISRLPFVKGIFTDNPELLHLPGIGGQREKTTKVSPAGKKKAKRASVRKKTTKRTPAKKKVGKGTQNPTSRKTRSSSLKKR